jgi:TPR repeat protein
MVTALQRLLSTALFACLLSLALPLWAAEADPLAAGQAAFNTGDYALAFAKWSELATTGHSDAQVFIGLSYANGWGVAKSPKLARLWYQKAAANGNPSGQFLLGLYYIGSEDMAETATGLMWLRRAAANGDVSAQRFLKKARARGWFKELTPPPLDAQPPLDPPVSDSQRMATADSP